MYKIHQDFLREKQQKSATKNNKSATDKLQIRIQVFLQVFPCQGWGKMENNTKRTPILL